ncbi:MAG: hypothetical protein J6A53_05710 [Clostridia bacterium]|nr:hypothetical protein [Clostridia bacterium]
MTELEKIEYAKSFIDKLANGINPLNDESIPENDIVNNVRLSRCFFYVSDILRQVIDNGGITTSIPIRKSKQSFRLTEEERAKISISKMPLSVSEISKYLNSLINLETTNKITANTINNWLLESGFLEISAQPNGKNRKIPTSYGRDIGIFTEERNSQYGKYIAVLYNEQAQQFIYDNIDAIIALKNEK